MSLVNKRSISLEGHKTSVTLEDEFWLALRVIAHREKTTVVSLVRLINQTRNKSNLSSAIRVFVLKRSAMIANQEKQQPNLSISAPA
jgi:predicted DNA-binding ribbon-helix-helix protein